MPEESFLCVEEARTLGGKLMTTGPFVPRFRGHSH